MLNAEFCMLDADVDADSAMHLIMSGKMRETISFPNIDVTSMICPVRFCLSSWYATRGRKKLVPEVEVEVQISELQLRPRLVTKRSHKNGRSAVEVDVEVDVEGEVEVKISELQ